MLMLYRVLISVDYLVREYFFDNLLLKGSFVKQHILVVVNYSLNPFVYGIYGI